MFRGDFGRRTYIGTVERGCHGKVAAEGWYMNLRTSVSLGSSQQFLAVHYNQLSRVIGDWIVSRHIEC